MKKLKILINWKRFRSEKAGEAILQHNVLCERATGHLQKETSCIIAGIDPKRQNSHIALADPDGDKYSRIEKIKFMRLWMDYDEVRGWYPIKNTDIQLRWMCIVLKKDKKKT